MTDTLKRAIKLTILAVAQWLGLFALARRLTRHEARILCYHGFAYRDEHRFAPKLFMTPATFHKRVEHIEQAGYTVVPLAQLVEKLERHESITNLLVLTVDDGWTGFARFAWPVLKAKQLPCTLYYTTWYAQKERPVLNVLRRYLHWHGATLPAEHVDNVMEYQQLQAAAVAAGISLHIEDGEMFHLSTPTIARQLAQEGLDIQLHTHRHCLPLDGDALRNELQQNRDIIESLSQCQANDLCYPSGEYSAAHLPLLRQNGIRSATTTRLGLVKADCDRLQLPRLLDGENWHPLEFAAELSGFMTLLRRVLARDDSAGVSVAPIQARS